MTGLLQALDTVEIGTPVGGIPTRGERIGEGYALTDLAAEKLVERHVERPSQRVVQGDVDAAQHLVCPRLPPQVHLQRRQLADVATDQHRLQPFPQGGQRRRCDRPVDVRHLPQSDNTRGGVQANDDVVGAGLLRVGRLALPHLAHRLYRYQLDASYLH